MCGEYGEIRYIPMNDDLWVHVQGHQVSVLSEAPDRVVIVFECQVDVVYLSNHLRRGDKERKSQNEMLDSSYFMRERFHMSLRHSLILSLILGVIDLYGG